MAELLEQAFTEAKKLPDSEQNAPAHLILAELEYERRWDTLFEKALWDFALLEQGVDF